MDMGSSAVCTAAAQLSRSRLQPAAAGPAPTYSPPAPSRSLPPAGRRRRGPRSRGPGALLRDERRRLLRIAPDVFARSGRRGRCPPAPVYRPILPDPALDPGQVIAPAKTPAGEDLAALTCPVLRERCKEQKLPSSGNKATLLQRLGAGAPEQLRGFTNEVFVAAASPVKTDGRAEQCPCCGVPVAPDHQCDVTPEEADCDSSEADCDSSEADSDSSEADSDSSKADSDSKELPDEKILEENKKKSRLVITLMPRRLSKDSED
jgi:hypothetical protein